MKVDLNNGTEVIKALSRFQTAKARISKLSFSASACLTVACALFLMALVVGAFARQSYWPTLLCNSSAAFFLLSAIVQSALRIDVWRAKALVDASQNPSIGEPKAPEILHPDRQPAIESKATKPDYLGDMLGRLLHKMGINALWFLAISAAALIVVYYGWNLSLPSVKSSRANYAVAGLLIFTAFGFLVVERHLSVTSKHEWPEANGIALIVRMVIAVKVLSLLALLFVDDGRTWPLRLLVLAGLLPTVIALEFALRAGLAIFSPQRDTLEPPLIGESFAAALLRWPPKPLHLLQDELHQRFKIDLRQVWAFGFMRRAFMPIFTSILAIGWLLSSVSEIPINRRGIYERFGQPVAVLAPGLHIGLPWPLGKVIFVEYGVIHEMATSNERNVQQSPVAASKKGSINADAVEGPAPASANRLWDFSHGSEKSQVIASASNDRQSFQILSMDVRFIYRIGLTDRDALMATYNSLDIPTLIQSTANRILVHDFASRTLDDVLSGQTRELAHDIKQALQQNLNELQSGIEVLAVVIEAIHPPSGAADAYHGVQAAQITSQILIAKERGDAAAKTNQAYIAKANLIDGAKADAKEAIAAAQSDALRFNAEKKAWQAAGEAFLLEHYFTHLTVSLTKSPLLIIDHRLPISEMPTIDLREFTVALDAGTKPNNQPKGD